MSEKPVGRVVIGDCLDALPTLSANSIDSIVTDPPYGIRFMSKAWDHGVPGVRFWAEALRVLKPGAFLLAFGGTRTAHRLACAIEDAGFDIVTQIPWIYGQGKPAVGFIKGAQDIWPGAGGSLKPANEPIIVARKPYRGTLTQNLRTHGCGAFNISACRVPTGNAVHNATCPSSSHTRNKGPRGRAGQPSALRRYGDRGGTNFQTLPGPRGGDPAGRWPANVLHDGSDAVLAEFARYGERGQTAPLTRRNSDKHRNTFGAFRGQEECAFFHGDTGTAARFFQSCPWSDGELDGLSLPFLYQPKAAPRERASSRHPTIKPLALIRYLVRLVTPPGGVSLDLFSGSGTHAEACVLEGFDYVDIELEPVNKPDIDHRIRRSAG